MKTLTDATTLPDPARADGGLVFLSTWSTGTPERQRAAVDAIAEAWASRPWPHEGLLSYTVYAGADGSTVAHRSQWRDDEAYQDFFARGRDERNAEIDAAVPGIERLGLNKTRLRGGVARAAGDERVAGAVVITEADADAEQAVPEDAPGLISVHFHETTDGARVIRYAEFESGDGLPEEGRYRLAYHFRPRR
ncbi:antibiotic biosynthesis monooxygenase [Streptomyces longisporoflavus]|uniref:Antibiotic biosynthesis monooxygenase n=1 Tax=Streptomyces longisporoflavus TaxID=28044 RepID=A0ABW7QMH5_9ACTN